MRTSASMNRINLAHLEIIGTQQTLNKMTDKERIDQLVTDYHALKNEIHKVIIGQDDVVDQVLIAIFSRAHCLLVGVPGLAKTLLVNTISETLGLSFNRVQFTPDLMPSDIVGSEILDESKDLNEVDQQIYLLTDALNKGDITQPPRTTKPFFTCLMSSLPG